MGAGSLWPPLRALIADFMNPPGEGGGPTHPRLLHVTKDRVFVDHSIRRLHMYKGPTLSTIFSLLLFFIHSPRARLNWGSLDGLATRPDQF
jgi:hypothetical protein